MILSDNLKFYLNTDLQGAVFSDNKTYDIHIMSGIINNKIITKTNKEFNINTFIPVMRHLDQLIEPLQYKGSNETIIPLFEIAKLSGVVYCDYPTSLFKVDNMDDERYGKILYFCSWKCKDDIEYKFFYSKEKQSFYISKVNCNDLPQIVSNQLNLLNGLYKWHFWLGSDKYFENNEILNINKL